MMKKLLIFMLVLGMTQVGLGVPTATLRVNPGDVKDHYMPSDIITLELITNFPVGQLAIGKVLGPGMASGPALNARLTEAPPVSPGILVNDGTLLIKSVSGNIADYPEIVPGVVLWTFEYHVPQVPASTIIDFGYYAVSIADLTYENYTDTIVGPSIHIIPEPTTIALLGLGGLLLRRRQK